MLIIKMTDVIYRCPRCNYFSDKKQNLERHFKKTIACSNINNVNLTEENKYSALNPPKPPRKPRNRGSNNGNNGNQNVAIDGNQNSSANANGESNVVGNQNNVYQHVIHYHQQPPSMSVFVEPLCDTFSTFEKVRILEEYFMIQREDRFTLKQFKLQRSRKRRILYEMYNFFLDKRSYRSLNDKDVMKEAIHIMMPRKFESDTTRKSLLSKLIAISDYNHTIVYFVDKNGDWKRVNLKEFIQEIIQEFSAFATLNEEFLAKFLYFAKYTKDPCLHRKAECLLINLYSLMICMNWTPYTSKITYDELFDTMNYNQEEHPMFDMIPEREKIGEYCLELYEEAKARTPEDTRDRVYKNIASNLEDHAIKCFAGKIGDIQKLFDEKHHEDPRFQQIIDKHSKQKMEDLDEEFDPYTIDMPDLIHYDDMEILPLSDREKKRKGINV